MPPELPAPDRGGPFDHGDVRGRRHRAPPPPPGDACDTGDPGVPAVESSPIGSLRRARALAATALFVAGLALVAWALAIHAKSQAGQWLLDIAWTRAQASGVAPAPWPWADTRPLAKLFAPAQGEETLVLAGANGRTLAWGPGHLDGTSRPGEPGNAVVTAHRDTHFRFLARAAVGDPLVVERLDGVRVTYRIAGTRIADAADLAIPRDADVPTLTLVTCWPFDAIVPGGPLRYVVVAEAESRLPARRDGARTLAAAPRPGP